MITEKITQKKDPGFYNKHFLYYDDEYLMVGGNKSSLIFGPMRTILKT